ncbi:MAG TPA: NTP transferase domain-containing protein, partial [Candidatus Limnocylindrales bacterium]
MAVPRADAIIVAAGASTRMDGTDKLLARLGDRPVLAHAVGALAASLSVDAIVIVTTDERRDALMTGGWVPPERTTFVDGGDR